MAIVTSATDPVGTGLKRGHAFEIRKTDSWQKFVKTAVRDPEELRRRLGLPTIADPQVAQADREFATFVPEPYLARIRPGDPNDPLLRQVLPAAAETMNSAGYLRDAVGDTAATVVPGLIHKYRGRVLLVSSGVCAVHCRYCFRRHFPYELTPRLDAEWDRAISQIKNDPSIGEVILSGGDPLMIADHKLQVQIDRIGEIPHVRRLRIHTRLPIVIPQRITPALMAALTNTHLTTIVVVHVNHPREIDGGVAATLSTLAGAGILLLNQTVLLAGVNDCPETLIELSERLVELRCLPYYLHQLDRVQGAAHFEVPQAEGRQLVEKMRNALPGYAVPRYVCEIAGDPAKRVLA